MEKNIKTLKIFLIVFGMYFLLAIITVLAALFNITSLNIPIFSDILSKMYNVLGSRGLGLFLVIFLAFFVASIFLLNKIDNLKTKEDESKNSKVKYKFVKLILFTNIVFAFVWFANVQNRVGGDPRFDGEKYVVYYRTEFIKNITEAEYIQYVNDKADVTKYIFSSIFLLFSGMIFLSINETYRENKLN